MGVAQARLVGEWVAKQSWAHTLGAGGLACILASPFARTVQTAHHMIEGMQSVLGTSVEGRFPVFIENGLAEGADWMSNNGQCRTPWHLSAEELREHSPWVDPAYESLKHPQFTHGSSYPGRPQELEEWYERCAQTAWRIAHFSAFSDKTVVIVTHAG